MKYAPTVIPTASATEVGAGGIAPISEEDFKLKDVASLLRANSGERYLLTPRQIEPLQPGRIHNRVRACARAAHAVHCDERLPSFRFFVCVCRVNGNQHSEKKKPSSKWLTTAANINGSRHDKRN